METMTINKAVSIKSVEGKNEQSILTGDEKLDNWLSGSKGFVVPSAIFLTGSSGAGKTTLMIDLMNKMSNEKTLMYSREMIKESVRQQTKGIKVEQTNALIADRNTCPTFEEFMVLLDNIKPKMVVIDSLQSIAQEDYKKISENEASAMIVERLRAWIEKNNAVLILIGHVTKEDVFAGKNTIMQYMDVHIEMIFHKKENFRTISFGQKNRKGPMGTLYYTIESNGINFFTAEEWEINNKKEATLTNDVLLIIKSNVDFLKKKNESQPWIKKFSKELSKSFAKIRKDYDTNPKMEEPEFLYEHLRVIKDLTNRFEIQAGI
jgi:predicted ATP-dependent serine protease